MTDDPRVQAIRQRADSATTGPWTAYQRRHPNQWAIESHNLSRLAELNGEQTSARLLVSEDAKFIAHAREDVPWLLDQLEAAEARAASAEQEREREGEIRDAAVRLQDKLLDENRSLRARLASAEADKVRLTQELAAWKAMNP